MTPKRKGIITAQKVIAKLLELGFDVSIPIGDNSSYDVILDWKNKLFKGQIKTVRKIKKNAGAIHLPTSSCRINTKKNYNTNYIGKVDFILGYYSKTETYLFYPVTKSSCTRGVDFRVSPSKNGQIKKINNIKDFELNNLINYINKLP